MENFGGKHFLTLAVLVLGIFASQSLRAEAACDSAKAELSSNSNCRACTKATCVWCGLTVTVSAHSLSADRTIHIGVCKPENDTCGDVSIGADALVGAYNIEGTSNVVQTTTISYTPFSGRCTCPSNSSGLVELATEGEKNCDKCIGAGGHYCKISIYSDASPEVKTSTFCLSGDWICAQLNNYIDAMYRGGIWSEVYDFGGIWMESTAANTSGDCANFSDTAPVESCRSQTNCDACQAMPPTGDEEYGTRCNWVAMRLMRAIPDVRGINSYYQVGSLLNNFGLCKPSISYTESTVMYDGLRSVADVDFADFIGYPLSLHAERESCSRHKDVVVDRVALSYLSTCEKCRAVTGLFWCKLRLKKSDVVTSSTGGVCVTDEATCQGYAVTTAQSGYTLEAGVARSCTPPIAGNCSAADCATCTSVGCVWCGARITIDPTTLRRTPFVDFPLGVCMPAGDDTCSKVPTNGLDALVGTYTTEGNNRVHTTSLSYRRVASRSCPTNAAGLVALGAGGANNCADCLGATPAGKYCKISIGSDASPVVKTSALCLSNESACFSLSNRAFDAFDEIWIESKTASFLDQCENFSDTDGVMSCRNQTNCKECKKEECQWCQSRVMNSASPSAPVGTLLNNFGKCKKYGATCDSQLTYDGIKPVANATFGSVVADTTTFSVDADITAGATCTRDVVDRVALADLSTCEKCQAVAGLFWCQLGLKKGDVAASPMPTGGVCVKDTATCTGYAVSAAQSGYTVEAVVATSCNLPIHGNCDAADCTTCTDAGCIWCGAKITIDRTVLRRTPVVAFPVGVCMPAGDRCTTVPTTGLDALVGAYNTEGNNRVHTTSVRYKPVDRLSCPTNTARLVELGTGVANNCANCLGATPAGKYCQISIGSDASPHVKTSELCLSNEYACSSLNAAAFDAFDEIWIQSTTWSVVDHCKYFSSTDEFYSCRNETNCKGCNKRPDCQWCQSRVMNSASPSAPVGTLLNNFGKCKTNGATCDSQLTYDGIKPVANATFGSVVADTTTFSVDGDITAGACTRDVVDRVALADLSTCDKCRAVAGLFWCQLGLKKGDVAASSIGGVCVKDTETCTGYAVSAAQSGYTVEAAVATACNLPIPGTIAAADCTTCTGAGSVWCGSKITIDGSTDIPFPLGVCMPAGDRCTTVPTTGLDALVGAYNTEGNNRVHTTSLRYSPVASGSCPSSTAGLVALGTDGANNCANCLRSTQYCRNATCLRAETAAQYCEISIGSDASPDVKTSALCLSNDSTCWKLGGPAFDADEIWIESTETNFLDNCEF